MVILIGLSAKLVIVETVFFHKDLEDIERNDCFMLDKCLYGLFKQQGKIMKKLMRSWKIGDSLETMSTLVFM